VCLKIAAEVKGLEKKDKRYLAAGLIFLAAAGILQAAARGSRTFATWYAHHIYTVIVGVVGRFFGLFPFSVVEICLYLLIFSAILYVVRFFRRPLRILARTVALCGLLLFLYTVNCGINYYAASFSEYVGLETKKYSKDELKELCEYLVDQANETATAEAYRNGNGGSWRGEGVRAMQAAAEEFSVLSGFYPKPKEVAVSWILSVQQLCGIYAPFTVEANFNGKMPNYNIPHSICHELSHLKGFMREDEANFIGYLACIRSERQAFRYSGYLTGWVYAGNALANVDREAYIELQGKLCDQARTDLDDNNEFWDRYEGKAAEVSSQMNDAYLKINSQEDGVKSYGRMVDLMLGYYKNGMGN